MTTLQLSMIALCVTLTVASSACGIRSGGNSCSDQSTEIDVDLTEEDVQTLLDEEQIDDRQALDCETACGRIARTQGRAINEIEECTLTIDAAPGGNTEQVVGMIDCRGSQRVCGD